MDKESEFIKNMFEKGVLVNKDLLEKKIDPSIIDKIEQESDLIVLNNDYVDVINQQTSLIDWYEVDIYRVEAEKERDDSIYQSHLQTFKQSTLMLNTPSFSQEQNINSLESDFDENSNFLLTIETSLDEELPADLLTVSLEEKLDSKEIEIVTSFKNVPKKYVVKDFTQIFLSRYRFLEGLLRNRKELENTMAINRLLSKKEKDNVALIGLVEDISETQKGNLILTLEDPTGKIKVLVTKTNKNLYGFAKELVVDEVVGISGISGDKIIFADAIIWPDIPSNNELKKSDKEEYMIFLSDIHVGSNLFMKEEFEKFLKWLNGELGNEKQREIAKNIKYIAIAGDLVDGIGIYPSQLEELKIKDIILQYQEFNNLIKQIPSNKQIIICPGNHDAVHLAEPQSAFDKSFSPTLFDLPNVTLVTNPAMVNVGKTKTFPGFNVLLYHGSSFDYYVAHVESIRNNGGYHRADLIMKFLLKRRHLAPSFKSTPYFPGHKEDPLLIKKIPDFFVSGHIHYSNISNYKGITTICGSCWQEKTSFQEKMGHEPEPARVPIVNLKTREVKILKFK
ncbi:MAG: DNA-directed DNA polymerase II small subunit [Nanoarchaeota archaeon]|nr:DNA-directed DNA polymerase II small subunit [Nanoarchaeota archaeon]MBU1644425.1 DNA-directed DNA polymerase II small subunit [Nanoarchaeota archaeon]MBU1976623.1 DNA-directed DNA polymerase II small subunit [Nanoarchaeota archaeon]